MKKKLLFYCFLPLFFLFGLTISGKAQLLLEENFDYPVGDSLGAHGWKTHSGGTTNTVKVATASITYPGYLSSGIGGEVSLLASGADVNRIITPQSTGSVYVSFILNIKTATATGDYFFHFGQTVMGTTFKGKLFVKSNASNKIAFGTSFGSNTGNYTTFDYDLNTVYLVVLKYSLNSGSSTDDQISVFINPVLGNAEPAPTVSNVDAPVEIATVGSIALRQGSSSNSPTLLIDGIRVGLTWADVIPAAADVTAPTFTAAPNNADINVAINTSIVLTFNEAIRNINDSEITDANVASLLTLKETNATGASVAFTATIDAAKKVITVTPTANLKNSQVYYAAIAPVEDAANNATTQSSMTFTTVVPSTGTISNVAIAGTVPYHAGDLVTITWVSSNVTNVKIEAWIPSGNKWEILFASTPSDGTESFTIPIDAQYSTDYKIRVTDVANPGVTAESSIFTIQAALSAVNIVGKTPYYAGDTVAITWASTNVANVKIEVWFALQNIWVVIFPSIPSVGFQGFIIPSFSPYSTEYKIRISDVANPTVSAESSKFTVIAVAPNLATLRAQPENSIVKYTGIATVTYARTSRNQKYIQDATAAVLIDDPTTAPGFITGTYAIGDGITNIVGKIVLYNGLIEFTPTEVTGKPATGIKIVPEVRTLASLTPADQCKLVKIENFAFKTPTQYSVDGKFVASKNYDIDGYANTAMAYRTAFAEADYIGGMVPVGTMSSVCLVGQFNAQMQITARSWSDMTLPFVLPKLVITEIMYNSPGSDEEWIEVYNNGLSSVDMAGYYILDSDPLHIPDPMVIPSNSIIAPGAYFTIETATSGAFPFAPNCNVLGTTTAGKFNLGNTSDQVKLYHSNGKLIDSVQYANSAPWPTTAGPSLTLCNPNSDNSLAANWELSLDAFTTLQGATIYATPGTGCVLHTAIATSFQKAINIYPNPTSDKLYISNPVNEELEITILSSIGKPVKSVQSNQGVTSVDLSELPKGIYLVKMINKTTKTTQIKKIVVR